MNLLIYMRIMKTYLVPALLSQIKWLVVSSALTTVLLLNASAQTNILSNPGFESGSLSGWTTFGANNSIQSGGRP